MQQFDNGDRPIRIGADDINFEPDENGGEVVQPASTVSVKFKTYTNLDIQGQIEFKVVPISSLSTSPAAVASKWLKFYELGLIDELYWHRHERLPGFKTEVPRMLKQDEQNAAKAAALKSVKQSKTVERQPALGRTITPRACGDSMSKDNERWHI